MESSNTLPLSNLPYLYDIATRLYQSYITSQNRENVRSMIASSITTPLFINNLIGGNYLP